MSAIVPHSFLFRFSFPVRRLDGIPKRGKRLLELGPEFTLPDLADLRDRPPFGEVRIAWNDDGIGIAVEVRGKLRPVHGDSNLPEYADGVSVWIDTRNTQSIHRASQYCHQFCFAPIGSIGSRKPVAIQREIQQAREKSRLAPKGNLLVASEVRDDGYLLEAFIRGEQLQGYDPAADREAGQPTKLGFFYAIKDLELGLQTLTADNNFPYSHDPSLWSTLELIGRSAT